MTNDDLTYRVKELIFPVLEQEQAALVDLEIKGTAGGKVVRIFADTDNGIQVDQCVRLTREINDLLEIENIFRGNYRLEVSSPGLDRPLRTPADFRRNIGKKVKISTKQEDANMKCVGDIIGVNESSVTIRTLKNGAEKTFDINAIDKAMIQIVWS